ncbi:MAG: radical SAM protein [Pseudolabrys sp.]|nr:radical SAM protein [Pseudolabrys sp.]
MPLKQQLKDWVRVTPVGRQLVRWRDRRPLPPSLFRTRAIAAAVSSVKELNHGESARARLLAPKLDTARIETTNVCNLNCVGCGTKLATRTRSFINDELFRSALAELKRQGLHSAGLYTVGEPLLSKNLSDLIGVAFDHDFGIGFSTNGSYPDRIETIYRRFKHKLVGARFSVDAVRPETYAKIRLDGNFAAVLESIRRIHKINDGIINKYITITTKNLVMDDNIYELNEFFDVFGDYIRPHNNIFSLPTNMSLHDGFVDTTVNFPALVRENSPCDLPAHTCAVNADGSVTLCYCRDFNGELIAGNIKEQSLEQIFYGEKAREIREKQLGLREQDATCCIGCNSVYGFANSILNAFIQFLNASGFTSSGIIFGRRILEMLADLDRAARTKDPTQIENAIALHFR